MIPQSAVGGTSALALRFAAARRLMRLAFRLVRPKRLYEPVDLGGRRFSGKRDAELRWQALGEAIRHYEARTILDIGCAEGWFLRRAASEFGCFGIGIDADDRRVMAGEIARLHDGAERYAVIRARLDPDDIRVLPRCDLVLCLSVVHHVIRQGGLPAAEAFVGALAGRSRRALIFEMGTSDEKALEWSALLPDMPGGQEEFVRRLLGSAGLANIRVIAKTPGLKGDALRLLFAAEPADPPLPDWR